MPCCFISFSSEIVSKALDCFGNRSCSDKVAVGKAGCLELSLCFSVCNYRVTLRQCLKWCLSQVTLYCTGSEPGKNTDDHLVKKNNSDAAFSFVSFSVHAVAVY